MKIKSVGNKFISRIEAIAGVILVALGIAITSNKWVDNLFLSIISFLKRRPPHPVWSVKLHQIGVGTLVVGLVVIGLFILPYLDSLKQNERILQLAQKWDRLIQNKTAQIMASAGAILFIAMLITVEEFSFGYIDNEWDVLPSIKQVADPAWLPKDWYLNINTSYRDLFGFLFGPFVTRFGFENGAYLGRLIVYLLVAIGIFLFFRTLHLRPSFGILVLLIFLSHQSLIASEGIVGDFETKTIAYAMVFLSLAFFLRKRYFIGFVFAGAAISFHVLIGIYALFCMVVAFLLNQSWRTEWRLYIKNSWPLLVTGIFGLRAMVEQLLPQKGINLEQAWNIYIKFRNPQHLLPSAWSTSTPWMAELVLATGFFLIMYFLSNSKVTRFVAAFALGSACLFWFGLVIYALGDIQLLRFYWFRFPDVMIPFMSTALIALFLNDFADRSIIKTSLFQRFQFGLQTLLRLLPPAIVVFLIIVAAQQIDRLQVSYDASLHPQPATMQSAFDWISKNTPKQAIFLVDPSESHFYVYAQRAMLVSWKCIPDSAAAILEWYQRIKLCNGNVDPVSNGYSSLGELHNNFYKLGQTQIQQIADLYGLNYYLGLANQKFTFERVYSDSTYAVYKIK